MSRIIEFSTNKGPVYVEVDDSDALKGEVLAANDSGVAAKAKKTFEEALQSVKPGIEEALALITDLIKKPTETEIEFGLKIDAAAGAVFAKAGAEATFNIKLIWK
jgi:predicted RNase H-like HicB family nuclease